MVPLHLGPLHPAEQVLVVVLALGPFLLLVLTVWISRRRHTGEDGSLGSADEGESARHRAPGGD